MKYLSAVFSLVLAFQTADAENFCSYALSLATEGKLGFSRISEGKDFYEPLEKFKLPGSNECFLVDPSSKNEVGELVCIWRHSKFSEVSNLNSRAATMLEGFKKCYASRVSEVDESETTYRGRLNGTGDAAIRGVGDWVEISTEVEASDSERAIKLYFRYSSFE